MQQIEYEADMKLTLTFRVQPLFGIGYGNLLAYRKVPKHENVLTFQKCPNCACTLLAAGRLSF